MKTMTKSKRNKPEILAPAGTFDALKAAVNAGCDAVYLGGDMFGARAYAGNFGTDEMIKALDYCHVFGVKIYMTVNTLLKEDETPLLIPYMAPFYEAGLDAVIVQDMGVVRILQSAFPDLALHASTQMSISSEYGARLMKRLGLTRIVPARELTLDEIITIRNHVDIEIESFVHGAMCYAYSGKCLFSGFFGGRSGNRGRCAQPCRQRYEIDGIRTKDKPYILSLKDMCMLSDIPELAQAGIDSFKIEGRMKNPTYVAAVTDAYRRAVDKYLELQNACPDRNIKDHPEYRQLADELTEKMQDIYNRGGFCSGYYYDQTFGGARNASGSASKTSGAALKAAASGEEEGRHLPKNEMKADERPNHAGLLVGSICAVRPPEIDIRLIRDVHAQDVLEIVRTGTELTSHMSGRKGSVLTLKGKELKKIKPGMQVLRTRNNALIEEIGDTVLKRERKIDARAHILANIGQPLQITISESRPDDPEPAPSGRIKPVTVHAAGNVVERAGSVPVTKEQLLSKMSKTGGTNLQLHTVCEMDDDSFVAMSDFNNLRRKAMEEFRQALCERYRRSQR